MTDFYKLSTELNNTANLIQKKDGEVEDARLVYMQSKANYERLVAKALIETKLRNPDMTQTDIKAESVIITYDDKMASIIAESKYKKLVGELRSLRDKLDALKECAYNLRCEAKLTPQIQK